jgi:hypothetical protein
MLAKQEIHYELSAALFSNTKAAFLKPHLLIHTVVIEFTELAIRVDELFIIITY